MTHAVVVYVAPNATLIQEIERMNVLLVEARRTLEQVKKGLEVKDARMQWYYYSSATVRRAKMHQKYYTVFSCRADFRRLCVSQMTLKEKMPRQPIFLIYVQGALNMTESMEQLSASVYMGRVPEAWKPYAYESRKQLAPWWVTPGHEKPIPALPSVA